MTGKKSGGKSHCSSGACIGGAWNTLTAQNPIGPWSPSADSAPIFMPSETWSTSPASPFDIIGIIIAVITVSAVMAGTWLFIGVKEYRFFANWNRRYSKYKTMQEQVYKELDDTSG